MIFNSEEKPLSLSENERKKYLFLRQVETLNSFLASGAITKAQYDFSYNGLVTKMKISEEELAQWLNK